MTDSPLRTSKSGSTLRRMRTSGWALILTLAVVGFGLIASRSAPVVDRGPLTGGPAQAQAAVEALISPGPIAEALNRLPADFTEVTGVKPGQLAARDGTVRAVHTDGGCSTPWGDDNTKWDFSVPCKAHDLGYDLLRYADKKGQPMAPRFREALDNRLSSDMHALCGINPMESARGCQFMASLYSAGLVVNSWHQRWGPPVGDALTPMLAGIAVIACLITFRLSDWLRHRRLHRGRSRPLSMTVGKELTLDKGTPVDGEREGNQLPSWTFLGVSSMVLLILGEAALAVAGWAGLSETWLIPFTWLIQFSPLFFFASGQAAISGWRAEQASGGHYRTYLAHRASWALRPAMIFVVVALLIPLALELLGIPIGVNAAVVRIALHPLWLIGIYLLTTAATPIAMWLHQHAGKTATALLFALVLVSEIIAHQTNSPIPHYLSALTLALLIQQAVFWFNDGVIRRAWLITGVFLGIAGAIMLTAVLGFTPLLINNSSEPAALSATTLPVLALGIAQLSLLGLLRKPLKRLAAKPALQLLTHLALRAPMSLYLGFLAAMLLVVALVSLRDKIGGVLAWLVEPRALIALAILMGPAIAVFWWFERNRVPHPKLASGVSDRTGKLGSLLSITATVLGIGYAVVGMFGFALTKLDGSLDISTFSLRGNPIQSLVQLLLGVYLLHTVRTGSSAAMSTWILTALACVPPLLFALDADVPEKAVAVLYGSIAVFALVLAVLAAISRFRQSGTKSELMAPAPLENPQLENPS